MAEFKLQLQFQPQLLLQYKLLALLELGTAQPQLVLYFREQIAYGC